MNGAPKGRWRGRAAFAGCVLAVALSSPGVGHANAQPPSGAELTTFVAALADGRASTRPPGSAPLGDLTAAILVRRGRSEPRPDNYTANHRTPTAAEREAFYNASGSGSQVPGPYRRQVTGNFTGTTDEILQWGAYKWGIDEDILRAVAVAETGWNQLWIGDNGYSYGLMQIKRPTGEQWNGWNGTHPLSQVSTAFNVDFYGAVLRRCLNGDESWRPAPYGAGDVWGCVGAWYSGGWYDQGAQNYIGSVKRHLANKRWTQPM